MNKKNSRWANVADQQYKGRLIQIRRDSGWVTFIDGERAVSGQASQKAAFASACWLIDNGKI